MSSSGTPLVATLIARTEASIRAERRLSDTRGEGHCSAIEKMPGTLRPSPSQPAARIVHSFNVMGAGDHALIPFGNDRLIVYYDRLAPLGGGYD